MCGVVRFADRGVLVLRVSPCISWPFSLIWPVGSLYMVGYFRVSLSPVQLELQMLTILPWLHSAADIAVTAGMLWYLRLRIQVRQM